MSKFTIEDLTVGLTEWHRRWVEDPDGFYSESEALATDPATYGEEAAPYLVAIIEELRQR